MEMYAIAEYKPLQPRLESKVLDIMKDLYMENEGVMKGMDISDPNNLMLMILLFPNILHHHLINYMTVMKSLLK